ncbi:MAG: hypothetical protein AAF146_22885 [Bacteroidota bacterium]
MNYFPYLLVLLLGATPPPTVAQTMGLVAGYQALFGPAEGLNTIVDRYNSSSSRDLREPLSDFRQLRGWSIRLLYSKDEVRMRKLLFDFGFDHRAQRREAVEVAPITGEATDRQLRLALHTGNVGVHLPLFVKNSWFGYGGLRAQVGVLSVGDRSDDGDWQRLQRSFYGDLEVVVRLVTNLTRTLGSGTNKSGWVLSIEPYYTIGADVFDGQTHNLSEADRVFNPNLTSSSPAELPLNLRGLGLRVSIGFLISLPRSSFTP